MAKKQQKTAKLLAKISFYTNLYGHKKEIAEMKMVIQVVEDATLTVDEKIISQIGKGLVVFFCAEKGDKEQDLDFFAKKIASLRIFSDANGKTNLSIKDVGGEILLVSQFTLAGEYYHGNRPSFSNAEDFELANAKYKQLSDILTRQYDLEVKLGAFGEHMIIRQTNSGPFTAYLER